MTRKYSSSPKLLSMPLSYKILVKALIGAKTLPISCHIKQEIKLIPAKGPQPDCQPPQAHKLQWHPAWACPQMSQQTEHTKQPMTKHMQNSLGWVGISPTQFNIKYSLQPTGCINPLLSFGCCNASCIRCWHWIMKQLAWAATFRATQVSELYATGKVGTIATKLQTTPLTSPAGISPSKLSWSCMHKHLGTPKKYTCQHTHIPTLSSDKLPH